MLRNYIEELLGKSGTKYNASPPTLTDGNSSTSLQVDSNGYLRVREQYMPGAEDNTNNVYATVVKKLAVSTHSPSLFQNLGANATLNVKATPGNVFAVKCHNINAAARYIQLFNTATTPSAGNVPTWVALVPTAVEVTFGEEFFSNAGINFSTGIAFAFSTTEATYTAGTASDQMTHIVYK